MAEDELQRCREELRKTKEQLADCRQELEANRGHQRQAPEESPPSQSREQALVTEFLECSSRDPMEVHLQQVCHTSDAWGAIGLRVE